MKTAGINGKTGAKGTPYSTPRNRKKQGNSRLFVEKGKIVDCGTPEYIIPKYDNKEFFVENV